MAFVATFAQEQEAKKSIDSLFREDQFYVALSYNIYENSPTGFSPYGFTSGLNVGFIRDMPINKNRHWSIGFGVGYGYNNSKHNVKVSENQDVFEYNFISETFDTNKWVFHSVEMPLEIRWRNASFDSHKFWRIYSGFKVSYIFSDKYVYNSLTENYTLKNNKNLNNLQYGTYMAVGNNSINMYAFYGLNSLLSDAYLDSKSIDLHTFQLGFMFYIL